MGAYRKSRGARFTSSKQKAVFSRQLNCRKLSDGAIGTPNVPGLGMRVLYRFCNEVRLTTVTGNSSFGPQIGGRSRLQKVNSAV